MDGASQDEVTSLGSGLVIGTAALIGALLPGALTGPTMPAKTLEPGDAISRVKRDETAAPLAKGDATTRVGKSEVSSRGDAPDVPASAVGAGSPTGAAGSPTGAAGSPTGGAGSPTGGAGSPTKGAGSPIGGAGSPTELTATRRDVDLPVVIVDDPLAHIPTVPAIPYLHSDDTSTQLSIRTEALGEAGTPEQAEALLDRYGANEPLIDRMLCADATPEQRDSIRRDLGLLPTSMVRRVAEAGTRIWAVPAEVTSVPASLFRADGRSDREIEAQWRQYNSNDTGYFGIPPASLKVQAKAPESIPPGNTTDMLAGYPWAGQTIEDMARFQGAGTPEEVAGFVRLIKMMNPRLREGQPLKAGVELNVPDVYIHHGQRYAKTTWNDIKFIDFELQNHRIDGLYVARQNLVVVLDETLADPSPVQGHRRITLHEFGHAVDYIAETDPVWGAEHRSTIDALHTSAVKKYADGDSAAFITDYARTNAAEHYADAFEAYYTGYRHDPVDASRPSSFDADYEVLMAREPDMAGLIAQDARHLEAAPIGLHGVSAHKPKEPTHVDTRNPRLTP